jgi:putative endonuclease
MNAFVYILKDDNNKFYIGSTNDLGRRMRQHRLGHTQTTNRMRNPVLVLSQKYKNLKTAREIEQRIKGLKRKDYIEKMILDGCIKIRPHSSMDRAPAF